MNRHQAVILAVRLAFRSGLIVAPALVQAAEGCAITYVVASGDTLTQIALRFYGHADAFKQIIAATRAATVRRGYAEIGNPNLIQPKTQLCLPDIPGGPVGLSLGDLANAEYRSEGIGSGTVRLTGGAYSAPAAPGSASRKELRLYWVRYGRVGSAPGAAVITWSSGGGSGTFFDLNFMVATPNRPTAVATVPLGDRVRILSLEISRDRIAVGLLEVGPGHPLCCPSQRMLRTYALQAGRLIQTSKPEAR